MAVKRKHISLTIKAKILIPCRLKQRRFSKTLETSITFDIKKA